MPSRVAIDTAAGTAAAVPESPAAAADADAAADLPVVTEEDLDGLSNKQLLDKCKIRGARSHLRRQTSAYQAPHGLATGH